MKENENNLKESCNESFLKVLMRKLRKCWILGSSVQPELRSQETNSKLHLPGLGVDVGHGLVVLLV